MPAFKNGEILGPETCHPLTHSFYPFFTGQFLFSLGKEEVGVSYDDLFSCLGNHIAKRQGELLGDNGSSTEADTDVPFTDQSMLWPPFSFKEFPPFVTVCQIRELTITADGRGMDKADADIME